MYKVLLPFALLASLFHVHESRTDYVKMVDKVSASVVRITGIAEESDGEMKPHTCSGFVISKNAIMTANHCLGEKLMVDGVPARVVKADQYYDLALLVAPSDKQPLPFRFSLVERYEDVTAIGYAYGWTKLAVLKDRVFLIDWSVEDGIPPSLVVQGALIRGMSGGPMVDKDGNVVGVSQRTNDGVGVGIGVLLIRAFMVGVE